MTEHTPPACDHKSNCSCLVSVVDRDRLKGIVDDLVALLKEFISIEEKANIATVGAQGQGLDGFTQLRYFSSLIPKARTAIAKATT